jgi:hypothetical protein
VAERYKVTLSLARVLWRARVWCWSASTRVWWSAPAADGGNCAHQTLLLLLLLLLLAPAAAAGPGRRRRAGPHPLGTSTGAGGREDGACSYIASGSTIHRIRSQLVMCIPSSTGGRIRVWTCAGWCISRWSWWFVWTGPRHDWVVASSSSSSMATGVLSQGGRATCGAKPPSPLGEQYQEQAVVP